MHTTPMYKSVCISMFSCCLDLKTWSETKPAKFNLDFSFVKLSVKQIIPAVRCFLQSLSFSLS